MPDQRALDAIARIESALGRIETASANVRTGSAELSRVREAHDRLRSRVEGAIGELDRLLEAEGRG